MNFTKSFYEHYEIYEEKFINLAREKYVYVCKNISDIYKFKRNSDLLISIDKFFRKIGKKNTRGHVQSFVRLNFMNVKERNIVRLTGR